MPARSSLAVGCADPGRTPLTPPDELRNAECPCLGVLRHGRDRIRVVYRPEDRDSVSLVQAGALVQVDWPHPTPPERS